MTLLKMLVYKLQKLGIKKRPLLGAVAICLVLADCGGLAGSFEPVASPFDAGNLFIEELETIKRATNFIGTQNLPHN